MAENRAAWGIEIGQAGLKAIKLRYAEAADQVVAVAFDYIPHPKILSQPDAIPEELIRDALKTFLSRNSVQGDLVSIALPGQSALAKFIQLPPVESSKVAEIVKYEARQQIPFPLEEVIWDFQPLSAGAEEGGFMLEAEVGLFAMKRDLVMKTLAPFQEQKVEIELIQIGPVATGNFGTYDRLRIAPGEEEKIVEDEYILMLDIGADNTTVTVTNGAKIWIRNVPLGGNHFTRSLTKEMKLTFAKAEHLKCNATKSPDPRAVFQAMRPVFNDFVSEIQRSIGFFSSVKRNSKITKIVGVGNGFKLAGLQKFLQQNLSYEVEKVEKYDSLAGDAVTDAPLFQDNILTFHIPYGMALQLLKRTRIKTSLLPPEIALAREVKRKKPWAVATAASLLVGLSISAIGYANVYSSVSEDRFGEAEKKAADLNSKVNGYQGTYDQAVGTYEGLRAEGDSLIAGIKEDIWLEFYRSLNACLPRDTGNLQDEEDIQKKRRIMLQSVTSTYEPDLASWHEGLASGVKEFMKPAEKETPPEGSGYVFTVQGLHYHHNPDNPATEVRVNWVLSTLLKNLQQWVVKRNTGVYPVGKLGISHATLVRSGTQPLYIEKEDPSAQLGKPQINVLDPKRARSATREFNYGAESEYNYEEGSEYNYEEGSDDYYNEGSSGRLRPGQNPDDENLLRLEETWFEIQFVWKPTPKSERVEEDPNAESTSENEEQ